MERPIIFVVHSLGGIVVKSVGAIVRLSSGCRPDDCRRLFIRMPLAEGR
jgi:hypothetical protein